MKKQKICVLGDGLSGLTASLILGKLDIELHIIIRNDKQKKLNDPRTTAISPSNFNFLSNYLNSKDLKSFWACKNINLFYEKLDQFNNFLNFYENGKNLLYIIQNNNLRKILLSKIKKNKNIKIIQNEVKKVDTKNSRIILKNNKSRDYDFILLCLGRRSKIISDLVGKRYIQNDSKEVAFTSIVRHDSNIANAKQYFLKEGPLAILPINEKTFSFVWSVPDKYKNIESLVYSKFKKILGPKTNFFFKKSTNFPISFKFNSNFSQNNSVVLGDGSYNVHPVAGQGFNLILRDIIKLYEYTENNISLGLPIKDSLIIKKFVNTRKPENLLFGLGISFTNNFFKHNEKTFPIKEFILKDIDKFKLLKDLSIKVSDKGIFQSFK